VHRDELCVHLSESFLLGEKHHVALGLDAFHEVVELPVLVLGKSRIFKTDECEVFSHWQRKLNGFMEHCFDELKAALFRDQFEQNHRVTLL
jgi:hypothetical protein